MRLQYDELRSLMKMNEIKKSKLGSAAEIGKYTMARLQPCPKMSIEKSC